MDRTVLSLIKVCDLHCAPTLVRSRSSQNGWLDTSIRFTTASKKWPYCETTVTSDSSSTNDTACPKALIKQRPHCEIRQWSTQILFDQRHRLPFGFDELLPVCLNLLGECPNWEQATLIWTASTECSNPMTSYRWHKLKLFTATCCRPILLGGSQGWLSVLPVMVNSFWCLLWLSITSTRLPNAILVQLIPFGRLPCSVLLLTVITNDSS